MKRYFTSDWHLGSELILQKCCRPFKSVQKMNDALIKKANQRLKKSEQDIVYHVGDFMCYKNDRGYKGSDLKPIDYLSQINANVVLIKGNHDITNKVKCHMDSMITNVGPYEYCSVSHYPSFYDETKILNLRNHSIHICGHVHGKGKWLYFYDTYNDILNINVGVDLWNYNIVQESKIVELIEQLLPTLNKKSCIVRKPY